MRMVLFAAATFAALHGAAEANLPELAEHVFKGLELPVHYFAERPIEEGSPCEVAAVIVHGWGDGASSKPLELDSFRRTAAKLLGEGAPQPYVIGPLFARREILNRHKTPIDGRAMWNESWSKDLSKRGSQDDDWRGGGDAVGTTMSSFDVIDMIFATLGDRKLFPNLKRVFMSGFSAGGQFVGRYVAVGKGVVRDGVEIVFAAMAPSTELRLDEDVAWHYGIKDRPRYSRGLSPAQIYANLSSRRVFRACGTCDTAPGAVDICPEAKPQGANRFDRFLNFAKYIERYPEWSKMVSFHPYLGLKHEWFRAYEREVLVRYALGLPRHGPLSDEEKMARTEGRPSETERSGRKEVLVAQPDYVVYVPRQTFSRSKRDPGIRGDAYNDHFQVIADERRGLMYAFWTQASWEAAPDQHIAFSRSDDGGVTWSDPVTLAGGDTLRIPRLRASWQQPMLSKSGRLYCLWNQQTTSRPPHTGMMFGIYSDDCGETWSEPKLVPFGHRADYDPADATMPPDWCNWQRPLRLAADGRYFVCSSRHGKRPGDVHVQTVVEFWRFENIDDDPEPDKIKISCFATDKDALSADKIDAGGERIMKPSGKNHAAVEEAGIVKLPDGRLFSLSRTSIGYPVWSVSADGGETWSNPKILRDRTGRAILHSRSPCPIYDWKGCEAASGLYFALVHDVFDFEAERSYQLRGPLFLMAGRFAPDAEQPIEFAPPKPFALRPVGNAYYSSYTVVDGEGVLWFNDRKYFLFGRVVGPEWFREQ